MYFNPALRGSVISDFELSSIVGIARMMPYPNLCSIDWPLTHSAPGLDEFDA